MGWDTMWVSCAFKLTGLKSSQVQYHAVSTGTTTNLGSVLFPWVACATRILFSNIVEFYFFLQL